MLTLYNEELDAVVRSYEEGASLFAEPAATERLAVHEKIRSLWDEESDQYELAVQLMGLAWRAGHELAKMDPDGRSRTDWVQQLVNDEALEVESLRGAGRRPVLRGNQSCNPTARHSPLCGAIPDHERSGNHLREQRERH